MRKRYRVLFLSALVALIVPVGYALSIETESRTARYTTVTPAAAAVVAAPVMMPRVVDAAPKSVVYLVSDSAKLLFVGTLLVGLAAAVRRAI
jgi:hypothetical protein